MPGRIDWSDPCQALPRLKAAYNRLLSGEAVASINYQALGVTREVTFSRADISQLLKAIMMAETDCAAQNGVTIKKRHAIQFGIRRRVY